LIPEGVAPATPSFFAPFSQNPAVGGAHRASARFDVIQRTANGGPYKVWFKIHTLVGENCVLTWERVKIKNKL